MIQYYPQPSIEIGSLRIDEPITTVTDILLACICFIAFYNIRKHESELKIKWYFKYYFLTLGIGTLCGGLLGHAFLYRLSAPWKLVSWVFTLASVGLIAHGLIELSRPLLRPALTRMIGRANILILLVALFYTLWTLAFSPVKYYTIFGMVVIVGSLSYYIYTKTGSKGVVRLMVAVGLGLVSAFVFSYQWGLSPWFNHNDLSHVILSGSVIILYKGASAILDTSGAWL